MLTTIVILAVAGMEENLPGAFPYTAGVFPFKREGEDPTRMFAGEGDAFRTNRRFKKVSEGMTTRWARQWWRSTPWWRSSKVVSARLPTARRR